MDIVDRLLSRIKVNAAGCFEWQGWRSRRGYGFISVKCIDTLVHRVSYEAFRGQIPDGMVICHRCDNTSCLNPSHLFIGTNKDNTHDALKKGRFAIGSRSGMSKLKEHQVREILLSPKSINELAEEYGVWPGTIRFIVKRQTWRHVTV